MFEIYKSRTFLLAQRFRWRVVAENNRVVAASSEGFFSRSGAGANALLTREALNKAYVDGTLLSEGQGRGDAP